MKPLVGFETPADLDRWLPSWRAQVGDLPAEPAGPRTVTTSPRAQSFSAEQPARDEHHDGRVAGSAGYGFRLSVLFGSADCDWRDSGRVGALQGTQAMTWWRLFIEIWGSCPRLYC
jgi:hypothetical protein